MYLSALVLARLKLSELFRLAQGERCTTAQKEILGENADIHEVYSSSCLAVSNHGNMSTHMDVWLRWQLRENKWQYTRYQVAGTLHLPIAGRERAKKEKKWRGEIHSRGSNTQLNCGRQQDLLTSEEWETNFSFATMPLCAWQVTFSLCLVTLWEGERERETRECPSLPFTRVNSVSLFAYCTLTRTLAYFRKYMSPKSPSTQLVLTAWLKFIASRLSYSSSPHKSQQDQVKPRIH